MKKENPLVAFMAIFNYVTLLNSNLDNCIDETDIPFYDELSHTFNKLHRDMTSLCLKD